MGGSFKDNIKKLDLPLFFAVLALTVIGLLLVASASYSMGQMSKILVVQGAAVIIGLFLCFVFAFSDFEKLAAKSGVIYILNLILLISVLLIGIGKEEVGGKSWIRFGGIGIQPAELVKIGYIITFSALLSKIGDEINSPKNVFICILHTAVIIGLILLQPDVGTAMVFMAVFLGMMFIAKLSFKYILAGAGIIGISIVPIWMFVLQEYQKNRIRVFFNPELDPQQNGYHVIQSKIAVGSGGAFGKGLFNGVQTQMGYLPARHTDFIFAVAGEELGFVGGIVIVFLIAFIIGRILMIGINCKESSGTFMATGIAVMFLAQSFENIGMTIGLTPVTGITLPFLSYGGSSIVASFIAIGIALNIHIKNRGLNF